MHLCLFHRLFYPCGRMRCFCLGVYCIPGNGIDNFFLFFLKHAFSLFSSELKLPAFQDHGSNLEGIRCLKSVENIGFCCSVPSVCVFEDSFNRQNIFKAYVFSSLVGQSSFGLDQDFEVFAASFKPSSHCLVQGHHFQIPSPKYNNFENPKIL